jgi:hypothetical protein
LAISKEKLTKLKEFSQARLKEEVKRDLDPLSPENIEATRT